LSPQIIRLNERRSVMAINFFIREKFIT